MTKKRYLIGAFVLITGFGFYLTSCGEKEGSAVVSCKMATEWKTVQDFQYEKNGENESKAYSLDIDEKGNIYVVGIGAANSSGLGSDKIIIIQKSTDGGASWETVDKYQHTADQPTGGAIGYANVHNASFLVHSDGSLYATFAAYFGAPGEGGTYAVWIVRKSTDGGATWKNVDGFYSTGAWLSSFPLGITECPNGDIYVSGSNSTTTSLKQLIRKSTDYGNTWSNTSSNFQPATNMMVVGYSITCDSFGNVYTSGAYNDASGVGRWFVRKSKNNESFVVVDKYRKTTSYGSQALGVFVNNKEDIFAFGASDDSDGSANDTNAAYWTIRRSKDLGVNWDLVDEYRLEGEKDAYAYNMTEGKDGTLYAGGFAEDENGIRKWLVRKSSDGGSHWGNSDIYTYSKDKISSAFDIKSDNLGNLYAVGYVVNESDQTRWVVRKLACE